MLAANKFQDQIISPVPVAINRNIIACRYSKKNLMVIRKTLIHVSQCYNDVKNQTYIAFFYVSKMTFLGKNVIFFLLLVQT